MIDNEVTMVRGCELHFAEGGTGQPVAYFTLFRQTGPCRITALQGPVGASRGCEARPLDQ